MKKRTSNIQRSTLNIECGAASRDCLNRSLRYGRDDRGTCEDCCYSVPTGVRGERILTCRNKAGGGGRIWVVERGGRCENFTRDKELLAPEFVQALSEGAKLIPLTQDKYAIVDAEDYEELSGYKWHVSKEGRTNYARSQKKGKTIRMHRLIMGAPRGLFVDHRNHNGLDNRKANLRLCSRLENIHNQLPRRGGSSQYKGVYWRKRGKRFVAAICVDGKRVSLGYFDDEIAAAKAYDKKAFELFGEFAYLNFPDEL